MTAGLRKSNFAKSIFIRKASMTDLFNRTNITPTILALAMLFPILMFLAPALKAQEKPKLALTFDDPNARDMPGYPLADWNGRILSTLAKHGLQAALFVRGNLVDDQAGASVIAAWNEAGHKIANHSWSHPYFHSEKISLADFEGEFLRTDSLIRTYDNYFPYFRFPYLKEGNTFEKRDGFRRFLAEQGYQAGAVTIDASDWYVSMRLIKRLKADPEADITGYRDFYIRHLFERAQFYDSLATEITGRKITHTLLLHHNLAAALFLDDLLQYFAANGWDIIDAEKAFRDEVFRQQPDILPAGESLIWAMAKETGRFEAVLRYPAEDGEYEEAEMDRLGL
ncbi:MAG TPA: polysaccharide deacetylase family protein [Calditrichia bacterium]|nr:polysaccharide deacetylase family protein [Calditrichota bacterium]HQV31750.1 polysaccharide deacetylase family protein [Calditrichia bacterium]